MNKAGNSKQYELEEGKIGFVNLDLERVLSNPTVIMSEAKQSRIAFRDCFGTSCLAMTPEQSHLDMFRI